MSRLVIPSGYVVQVLSGTQVCTLDPGDSLLDVWDHESGTFKLAKLQAAETKAANEAIANLTINQARVIK